MSGCASLLARQRSIRQLGATCYPYMPYSYRGGILEVDGQCDHPVRKAILYLFHNRWRMRYHRFRQAGYPIGSGIDHRTLVRDCQEG